MLKSIHLGEWAMALPGSVQILFSMYNIHCYIILQLMSLRAKMFLTNVVIKYSYLDLKFFYFT